MTFTAQFRPKFWRSQNLSNQKLWKARSENNFFLFFEINFIAILFIDFNDIANVKVDIITLHSENPLVLPEFNIICVF